MKETPDMEKRIETAIESLDGIQRATPQPYFYTRLKARLDRKERDWAGITGFISRPAYALAMICLVLLINTWAVMNSSNDSSQVNSIQVATDQQLPDEYNVAVNTFYDYEIPSSN
jgi:Na+/proline symporter